MSDSTPDPVILGSGRLTPADIVAVARAARPVALAHEARATLQRERDALEAAVAGGVKAYGVTTGLGARVNVAVPPEELSEVSARTVRGRATAVGPALPADVVRATLAVRANQMGGGGSGVQPAIAELLVAMVNADVLPEIPSYGSIGAGDLLPLAHMGLVVMGEGWATVGGERRAGAEALAQAGLAPVALGPKDGLALCSSSALSAALAALAFAGVEAVFEHAYRVAALSFVGFRANTGPLRPDVLAAHGSPGEARAGARMRELVPDQSRRLQDPLSFRCIAQVHGALEAALDFARPAVAAEVNGSSDNPVVLPSEGENPVVLPREGDNPVVLPREGENPVLLEGPGPADLVSNGNFQPSTLALALDTVALGLHQVAALSVARTAVLLDPALTSLPTNLSPFGSERSGFAPVIKVTQALLARIRRLAAPTYDDPRPGAAGVEDNSTSAPLGAERLSDMVDLLRRVIAAEALLAAQAIELRRGEEGGQEKAPALFAAIRSEVPALADDRPTGPDIEAVARLFNAQSPNG